MHYYQFSIGDYAKDTRHLSWDEDMAYRRLLDTYYAREEPIPLDKRSTYRLVCAQTPEQRQAVDDVLSEFFTKTDDGWRNPRADENIASFHLKSSKAAASAKARWDAKAKRPQKTEKASAVEIESDRIAIECERINNECGGNAIHKPLTINQEPINNKARAARFDAIAYLLSLGVDQSIASDWMQSRKQLKATVTKTAIDGIAREAAKAYISLTAALQECCARGWRGFKAEWIAEKSNGSETPYQKSQRLRFERLTGRTSPQEKVVSGEVLTLKGN